MQFFGPFETITKIIINAVHHQAINLWGIDSAVLAGDYYYNVIVYAMTMHGGGSLTIEHGFGKLSVLQFTR